jgi:signal transduction histidine kinase
VAHEIGNPIGIVLGYVDLLQKGNLEEAEKSDFLSRIESEITRINAIIRGLLDYSRLSEEEPGMIHVHGLLEDTVNMLKHQPDMNGVRVRMALNAEKDMIFADPNSLQQVFMNIMMNALDAFSEGGLSGAPDRQKELVVSSRNMDAGLEIVFEDNGPGIQGEDLDRLFDPFFTTKEPGKGTGLGLSVCYRIMETLGGTIHAESIPGEQTRFILTLPQKDEM